LYLERCWPREFGRTVERPLPPEKPDIIVTTELGLLQERHSIAELKTTAAQQQKQIEALTATLQKVSDQVALSKPAPQLVANP